MKGIPPGSIRDKKVNRGPKNRVPVLRALLLYRVKVGEKRHESGYKLKKDATELFEVTDSTAEDYVKKMLEWCDDIRVNGRNLEFTGDESKIHIKAV